VPPPDLATRSPRSLHAVDIEVRVPRPDEAEAAYAVCHEAFTNRPERREVWLATKRMDDFLCAWAGDELVATTETIPAGQYFGGRSVPMGAVASVAVRPDHRGRGLAPRLLSTAIEQMHERELVISTLHPATTRFYRGLGWEIAGQFGVRSVPASALAALPPGEPECMRPSAYDDRELVRECYARAAPAIEGSVDRSESFWAAWERELDVPHRYLYVYDAGGRIDGYVTYDQIETRRQWGFALTVHELVAVDAEAMLTLWRHVGSHATMVDEVTVLAAPLDALALLLPEQVVRLVDANHWMTRVIDAPGAIAARGFPSGIRATVELELIDRSAPWNDHRFVLDVSDGRGTLQRGGSGEVRVTVNGLASLYTGWASATTLAAAGLVDRAGNTALRTLDAMFAGPPPCLFDDF
jgi:predicted acetyltransferase